MFVRDLKIETIVEQEPNGLRSGRIEVSMTMDGFTSEQDMDEWAHRLAEAWRNQFDVRRLQIEAM